MVRPQNLRALKRQAAALGFTVSTTARGHLRCTLSNGTFVYTSGTPSDYRAWTNAVAKLRRVARENNWS
jgi:hypothetical protein